LFSSLLLALAFATSQPALSPSTAPEAVLPGIIDFGDERSQGVLTAPESAEVRKDYRLVIKTYGGGCEREGTTSVIFSATGANVFVYDVTTATRPDVICTAEVKRLTHTVVLQFHKPGEALLRIWGRRVGAETPPLGVPFVIEHRVSIR
jgi:hypothetical protein